MPLIATVFMKRSLFFIALLLLNSLSAKCQTTATDFTATDCNGVSHHLFDELDAGKIIVVTFVMPCSGCIGPSISANTVVNDYESTHPGKVIYYMSDDDAGTTCASLKTWASDNGFGRPLAITTFSAPEFKEADYGSLSMPKTVVLAGADHRIIYLEDGTFSAANMKSAIDNALLNTMGLTQLSIQNTVPCISPNPASHKFTLTYSLRSPEFVNASIYSISGEKAKNIIAEKQQAGKHEINVNLDEGFTSGIYFLELITGNTHKSEKFTVIK